MEPLDGGPAAALPKPAVMAGGNDAGVVDPQAGAAAVGVDIEAGGGGRRRRPDPDDLAGDHRRLAVVGVVVDDAHALAGSRWVTLYGENPWRVLYTGLAVIVLCAGLYPLAGGIEASKGVEWVQGAPWLKRLYFSVVTFTTLGYGDMYPKGKFASMLAMAESLVGAALLALLVAVLARRITR